MTITVGRGRKAFKVEMPCAEIFKQAPEKVQREAVAAISKWAGIL